MKLWWRFTVALALVFVQGLFVAPFTLAQQVSGNSLYVESEQVLAVPSQKGNTLQVLLSVNIQNIGAARAVVYNLPVGIQHDRVVAGSIKKISINAADQLQFIVKAHGLTTFAVEFSAPLNQNGTELTWQENMPVRKLFFLIPEGSLTASSQGGFQTDSASIISGTHAFRQFTKLEIPAGSPWSVSIALLPTANGRQASPLPNVPVLSSYGPRVADFEAVGNLLLVALILGIGIISIQRGSKTRTSGRPEVLRKQKAALMESWADLESAYAIGEVPESDYHLKRDRMKQRALQLETSLRQGQKP